MHSSRSGIVLICCSPAHLPQANFKLNREIASQCRAFLRGFHDLINVNWIRMFDARELQMVIGGEQRAIDVDNLRHFTRYSGGYHDSQPIMQWFWDALRSFTPAEQSDFLKFVTSCSRQPLLGFRYMNPPICIQKVPHRANLPKQGSLTEYLHSPPRRSSSRKEPIDYLRPQPA